MADILLEIKNLKVHFPIRSTNFFGGTTQYVKAVDGVSFYIEKGETLGLVGESGSGKTTVGRSILRAIEPTEGQVTFNLDGQKVDLTQLQGKDLRVFRRYMQLIFQDPYSSLNPRMTVRDIIAEPLVASKLATGKEVDRQVRETHSGRSSQSADGLAGRVRVYVPVHRPRSERGGAHLQTGGSDVSGSIL
jgi:peptide/nickel transport system ATP-binding protein